MAGLRGRQRNRSVGEYEAATSTADLSRPDDAGDGRFRVRGRGTGAPGVAVDSDRRDYFSGSHGRRPPPPQWQCRKDSAEGRRLARDAARPGSRSSCRQSSARSAAAGRGLGVMTTILIVEDNEMNRDMLSRRLERKGYKVLIAVDGEKGFEVARANTPDLILMDMSLPVVDGWEATRRLKADERLKHIPVIALTAHAMASDRDKALEAGCDDYDTKPIELARLLGKIEALLAAALEPVS